MHTLTSNSRLLERLRRRELDGLICSSVGEAALDLPDVAYAVSLQGCTGLSSDLQRMGRLSRTPRLEQRAHEVDDAFARRQRLAQRVARFYDLVTLGTEEQEALAKRRPLVAEVATKSITLSAKTAHDEFAEHERRTGRAGVVERTMKADRAARERILIRALRYHAFQTHSNEAQRASRRVTESARRKRAATPEPHVLMAGLAKKRMKRERERAHTESIMAANDVFDAIPLEPEVRGILRELRIEFSHDTTHTHTDAPGSSA